DARRLQRASELAPLGLRRLGVARAQPCATRVDANVASGLGVDQPQLADVGELLLARVTDLDCDHLVTSGQLKQRLAPVAWAAEVRDEDDQRALPRQRTGAVGRLA